MSGGRDVPEPLDRTLIMKLLETGLRESHRKVDNGRVRSPENEKVRQGWCRTLGYLANQHRQLAKDQDIDEMNDRLERIEQLVEEADLDGIDVDSSEFRIK